MNERRIRFLFPGTVRRADPVGWVVRYCTTAALLAVTALMLVVR